MSDKKPMTKEDRKDAALKTALKLARKCGAQRVSLAAVAAEHKVTPPLLFHIFGSHAKFVQALNRYAKAQGVVLPVPMPGKVKKLAKPTPVKLAKPAPAKKVAALLKPKVTPVVKPKLPINVVKAIKNKEAAKAAGTVKVNGKAIKPPKNVPAPLVAASKQLTPAQKKAKAAADAARRAKPTPTAPAAKFAALPKPFEAALQQIAA